MKERVDVLAVNQGLFETREQAKRGVMEGLVVAARSGERFDKPGQKIEADLELRLKGEKLRYVSRGGLKLEKALDVFNITIGEKVCLDIGASTGGFTDVMLQNGAKLVYALDVGTNQLAWKIRQDARVVVMEQFNFRKAVPEDFPEVPHFATIDVSFISLSLILPVLHAILADRGEVVALIKPQFEAGREDVGKNGIIKDEKVHRKVLETTLQMAIETGFSVLGLTFSPIKGGAGNVEFLVQLKKEEVARYAKSVAIDAVLSAEKESLGEKK
ncbi:MAG: TlyA family RNA methyltransferase [Streptococcaceae bacterium]|jgi:23S rRNA (cytidine1920-2'-O)/16S rRNA (cytidine1409-2'-O)-methyltransferase|nr:TlyA family RNA methyltransferase [Streptococcaceae bacterium]